MLRQRSESVQQRHPVLLPLSEAQDPADVDVAVAEGPRFYSNTIPRPDSFDPAICAITRWLSCSSDSAKLHTEHKAGAEREAARRTGLLQAAGA